PPPRRPAPLPPPAPVPRYLRPTRPAPDGAALAALRRRADPAGVLRGGGAAPADHPHLRRLRRDGALLPGPAAVPPRPPRRPRPHRGLRSRHPAHPHHPGAVLPRPRR